MCVCVCERELKESMTLSRSFFTLKEVKSRTGGGCVVDMVANSRLEAR